MPAQHLVELVHEGDRRQQLFARHRALAAAEHCRDAVGDRRHVIVAERNGLLDRHL
jgi:hypothetical protein